MVYPIDVRSASTDDARFNSIQVVRISSGSNNFLRRAAEVNQHLHIDFNP